MAGLHSCTGQRLTDTLLSKLEESIDDDCPERLNTILVDYGIRSSDLNRKHLLHKATWLGHMTCVSVLLAHGADPNWPHKKIGCPPLHLAHLCTIDDTDPAKTISILLDAGANINYKGTLKCNRFALDHAIRYQRLDAVDALVKCHSYINLSSVLTAIDVANPDILEKLLIYGGRCSGKIQETQFWGKAMERVISTPLKCPRVWYTTTFKLVTEATVCLPVFLTYLDTSFELPVHLEARNKAKIKQHSMIEDQLRVIAKEHVDLALYFLGFLIRNGYQPNTSILNYASGITSDERITWIKSYVNTPISLQDLTARILRTCLNSGSNILYGSVKLNVPKRIRDIISFKTES